MDWSRFNPMPDPETEKNKKGTGDDWSRFKPTPAPSPTPRGPKRVPPAIELTPAGPVHDGDTYRTQGGQNARLANVDAFELGQQGRDPFGNMVPIGQRSRNVLMQYATPSAMAQPTGAETYGRPVVNLNLGGADVGRSMVDRGAAIPDLRFIPRDQQDGYVASQRGAIGGERGVYGLQYQYPWDYRQLGNAAQWRGRIPMTDAEATEWEALIRNPRTTRADAERWLQARGHRAENLDNIMSLARMNPSMQPRRVFQQEDVRGDPVAPVKPFWTRQGAAIAEGVPDVLGIPGEYMEQMGPSTGWWYLPYAAAKQQLGPGHLEVDNKSKPGYVTLRWKRSVANSDLPEAYRLSEKSRPAVGRRRGDEDLVFNDELNKPKTGFRFTRPQEVQIERALLAGDGGKAMALARQFGGALDPGSVAATVNFVNQERAAGRRPRFAPGRSGVGYSRADRVATQAADETQRQSSAPFGAESIRTGMHGLGIGQTDESYAPQSTAERYLQAAERSLPSAAIPVVGERALVGNVTRQALATGIGGTVGTYIGAQVADDVAPGNELLSMAAQAIGGGAAGAGSRKLAAPRTRAPVEPVASTPASVPARMAMEADVEAAPSISAPVEPTVRGPGGRNSVTPEAAAELAKVAPEDVLPGPVGDAAPTMAGNIKLANIDTPQDIRQALDTVAQRAGGFEEARRGKITQEATQALADELGMTPRQLLGRRKGEAFNAEQALAARELLAKSGNEIVNRARKLSASIAEGKATDADLVAFQQNLRAHAAIQQEVAGMTAEAGRALAQFRIPADSRMVRGEVLRSLVDQAGGIENIKKIAETIIDNANDPKRMNLITRTLAKPGMKDKFIEIYYNFLLSGPRTHAVNVTSNIMTSLLQGPEHAAAALIGAPRMLTASKADRVLFTELGARMTGLMQGTREGLREAGRTLRTGEPADAASKVESVSHRAIGGPAGSVIRTPTRLLMAEDELFKGIARRMETVGLAMRQANAEGLTGSARRARAAELAANPTPEMLERADSYGRYLTFQTPLGKRGQAVLNLTNSSPTLKLFIPFVRTPLNILKFAAERSPAAPLLAEWRADIKAGGARRDLAIARVSLGTGAAMMAVQAAREGMLTGGGPADDKARNVWLAAGNQPYSIKIGDKFYSYQRLDPLATTLGMAADFVGLQEHMTDKQRENVAMTIAQSALQNLASKTWLSGMTDLAQALDDPGRYFENTFTRTAASITTPAISAQSTGAVDPVMRDARSLLDRIRSRIPGLSDELPARRDVMGNPIPTGNGGGLSAFSPVYSGQRSNDPLVNTLSDAGIGISRPQRGDFDPKQFEKYQVRAAEIFKPELQALVESPEWGAMSRDERQNEVDRVVSRARKEAKRSILLGEPAPSNPSAPDPWARFKPAKAQ